MADEERRRICAACGEVFTTTTRARTCQQCTKGHQRKTCTVCGKEFTTWFANQKRCWECCQAKKLLTRTCQLCGEEFGTNNYHTRYCRRCGGRTVGKQYRQEVSYSYRGTARSIRLSIPEIGACQLFVNGWKLGEISRRTGLPRRHLERLFEDKVVPGVREYLTATAEAEINKLTVEVQRIISAVIKEMGDKFLSEKKTKKDLHDWVRLTMDWLGRIGVVGEQPTRSTITDEEIVSLARQAQLEGGNKDDAQDEVLLDTAATPGEC